MKNLLIVLLFLVVVAVSALIFSQNDAQVELRYFGGSVHWQMDWILVTTFVLGFLVGVSFLMTSLISTKLKLASLKRSLVLKKKEISNLRELPIKEQY